MMRVLATIPKNALIAIGALLGCLITFAALWPTLGAARDGAIQDNARLISEIQQAIGAIGTAQSDQKYVADNLTKYEELIKSDRLIPHTRRTAVVRFQESAQLNGLVASWTFNAASADTAQGAISQTSSAAYRLSVENVSLKVSAPTDGAVYSFVDDVNVAFPGALIVSAVKIGRVDAVSEDLLRAVAEGRESALVTGEVEFIWRTAQAMETAK